ncbi:MAG: hypothetical protein R3191_04820 [Anaerolineales bacterium]|nr:hypothetical protein [Anaerolineales bacterium]
MQYERHRPARFPYLLPILALSLGVLACAGLEIETSSGDVLFQDDFSRPISGWDRHHGDDYDADYSNGAYIIRVNTPNSDVWSTPDLSFTDLQMQVEATKTAGPDDNLFGLICRYQDARNFYFFALSSDGYAGIGINKGGRRRIISGDALLPAEAIRQGSETNTVRADCEGFKLQLYVNGVLVRESQAAEWSQGDVGLLVGTYDDPGVEIRFDNLSVVMP